VPLVPPPPALPEELEAAAFARLPRAVYDYYAGGAGDEETLRDNRAAFGRVRLRPRVLTTPSAPTLRGPSSRGPSRPPSARAARRR
jgi:hypothetical protein